MHHHAHVAADILAPLELGDETPRDGLGAGTRAECGYYDGSADFPSPTFACGKKGYITLKSRGCAREGGR
jgi:hypothetical protein